MPWVSPWKQIFLVSLLVDSDIQPCPSAVTVPEDNSTVAAETPEFLKVHESVMPSTNTSITVVTAQRDVIHISSH